MFLWLKLNKADRKPQDRERFWGFFCLRFMVEICYNYQMLKATTTRYQASRTKSPRCQEVVRGRKHPPRTSSQQKVGIHSNIRPFHCQKHDLYPPSRPSTNGWRDVI